MKLGPIQIGKKTKRYGHRRPQSEEAMRIKMLKDVIKEHPDLKMEFVRKNFGLDGKKGDPLKDAETDLLAEKIGTDPELQASLLAAYKAKMEKQAGMPEGQEGEYYVPGQENTLDSLVANLEKLDGLRKVLFPESTPETGMAVFGKILAEAVKPGGAVSQILGQLATQARAEQLPLGGQGTPQSPAPQLPQTANPATTQGEMPEVAAPAEQILGVPLSALMTQAQTEPEECAQWIFITFYPKLDEFPPLQQVGITSTIAYLAAMPNETVLEILKEQKLDVSWQPFMASILSRPEWTEKLLNKLRELWQTGEREAEEEEADEPRTNEQPTS